MEARITEIVTIMPTIKERETLINELNPRRTGFTPRPIQKLATQKKPHGMINIECNHFLRTSTDGATHGISPISYRMWQEAGKHEAPFPERPDEQYNSNVWRNFRRSYGFHVSSDGQKISEMIANMYPLNIPAPSKVGEYTYEKFLRETPLIRDDKMRRLAIERTVRDTDEFKRLRLRSDSRNPPIDPEGKILPPHNYQQYVPRLLPPQTPPPEPQMLPPSENTRVDMFGRTVPKVRKEPRLYKLAYKVNCPEYRQIQDEIEKRKSMMPQPKSPIVLSLQQQS